MALAATVIVYAGMASGAPAPAQTGSGYSTQVLGEQFIRPRGTGSSHWGFIIGVLVAVLMVGGAALYGHHKQHTATI
jgi:hypothetical protein